MKKPWHALLAALVALAPQIAAAQQYNTLPPNSIVANVTGRSAPGNALAISDFIALLNLTTPVPAYTLRGNPTALSAVPTDFASTAGVMGWLATPSSANLAAALTDETGTGAAVFANAPTLVTPNLGTPSALNLANASGLPVGSVSGLGTGVATFLGTPSSANLRAALTDETGTGLAYFQGGDLGTPSAGVATNITGLNATNLSSGTVAAARGGAGAINGVLAANGSGVVSQGTCAGLSGVAASCSTDATNASNIGTGTLNSARLAYNGAVLNGSPTNPTATTSVTAVMMGLGVTTCTLTPTFSSRISFTIFGSATNSTANQAVGISLRFGTGAAPANGVAGTGTQLGATLNLSPSNGGNNQAFSITGIATGRTPGAAVWFDTAVNVGANTGTLSNLSCIAYEL